MPGSLKQLIQRCVTMEMPGLEIGIVMEVEPLRVTLQDDAKINLSAMSLVIPSARMPIEKGDMLYLLSLNGGKIYYALDKERREGQGDG